jgi:hypothetical protein
MTQIVYLSRSGKRYAAMACTVKVYMEEGEAVYKLIQEISLLIK